MSLGSYLLKRYLVHRLNSVPFSDIEFTYNELRKPVYKPLSPNPALDQNIEFNVSHQAGLVAGVAWAVPVNLGIDVVCVNERDDVGSIRRRGWSVWIQTFAEVFSEQEIVDIGDVSYLEAQFTSDPNSTDATDTTMPVEVIMARLRNFFAHWCLKEAYLKMTGEALVSPNLRELEFRGLVPPRPNLDGTASPWGETKALGNREFDVWFRGERVQGVQIWIQAFEKDYMVATAVRAGKEEVERLLGAEWRPRFDMTWIRDIIDAANSGTRS